MTRILVVDDELAIRTLVSDVLSDAGYVVATASNGADAMAAIESARPDVVLLDLVMPGMDGWSFLRTWQESAVLRGLPIGVMSAAPEGYRALSSHGSIRFIPKPFDVQDLLDMVGELATHSTVRYSVLHPGLSRASAIPT